MTAIRRSCRKSFEVYPTGGKSSPRGNWLVFLTICCVSFTIAGSFAWLGMWMILPFAGIEMLALAAALYICRRDLLYREVITIDGDEVSVAVGRVRMEQRCVLQRAWAKVLMLPGAGNEDHSLWIRSSGRQVEVGRRLGAKDKRALAHALERSIRETSAT